MYLTNVSHCGGSFNGNQLVILLYFVLLVNECPAVKLKVSIFGVRVSPGGAVTLVRLCRTADQLLITYCLSNISTKKYQDQLMHIGVSNNDRLKFLID